MMESQRSESLAGLRILVVEDNFLIASSLQRTLMSWGCTVVGPAPSVQEAVRLAMTEAVDGAILDINVKGGVSAPVAEALRRRGLPLFFITGYASPQMLPAQFKTIPRLHKPIDREELKSAMMDMFLEMC